MKTVFFSHFSCFFAVGMVMVCYEAGRWEAVIYVGKKNFKKMMVMLLEKLNPASELTLELSSLSVFGSGGRLW
jgi:hypothetical protein